MLISKFQIIVVLSSFILLTLFLIGCKQGENFSDNEIGLNGSFENSKKSFPLNWIIYNPEDRENSDFKISLDQTIAKEGTQSLKFDVKNCSSRGGRYSPGFTNEFFEAGQYLGTATYKVSFWIINNGTTYVVKSGGVSSKSGNLKRLIKSNEQNENWKKLEYEVTVEEGEHLRLEMNILSPGTFWIDDVKIEKLNP